MSCRIIIFLISSYLIFLHYEFIIGIANFMTYKKEKSEFLKEKFKQSRLVSQNFIIFWTLGSFCL